MSMIINPYAFGGVDPAPDYDAYYKFATSPTLTDDETGNFDLTNSNATFSSDRGGSASLNGTTASFITASAPIQPTSPMSVGMWVKLDDTSGSQYMLQNRSGGGIGFVFIGAVLRFTTYGKKDYTSSYNITASIWTHIAASLDSDKDVSFYADGVFIDKITHTAFGTNGADLIQIGERYDISQDFLGGGLDNIRLYQRNVTAAEWADIVAYES